MPKCKSLLLFSICYYYTKVTGLASIVVYGGLILFSAFLLHDTQRVVKLAESYPVVLKNQFNYDYEMQPLYSMRRFDPINAYAFLFFSSQKFLKYQLL